MVCVWFDTIWTQKDTSVNIYCHQVLVADRFERPSFWVHVSNKNLKLRFFFSAYLACITKVNRGMKLDLQGVEL